MTATPLNVVVVGGGIASLEAVLALRALAGDRVDVTVLAPGPAFTLPPMSVASSSGLGPAGEVLWEDVMREHDGRYVPSSATRVDPERRLVHARDGSSLAYDALLLAPGARSRPALSGALTLDARHAGPFAMIAGALERGWSRSVAFVVPGGCTWPLPLYEFALLAAARVQDRYGIAVHLVTPEPRPLAVFGRDASDAVAELLSAAGIIVHADVTTRLLDRRLLEVGAPMPLRVDRIAALAVMDGPAINGVPADAAGFIPVDDVGRVSGFDDVWAAGDATDQPLKQGGLACQEADAIAAQIAAAAGADVEDEPSPRVLRARLLGGSRDLYLRHTIGTQDSEASFEPLWSPPVKVVGRYLPAYLEGKGMSDRGRVAIP